MLTKEEIDQIPKYTAGYLRFLIERTELLIKIMEETCLDDPAGEIKEYQFGISLCKAELARRGEL